jgi:hypothetical protein
MVRKKEVVQEITTDLHNRPEPVRDLKPRLAQRLEWHHGALQDPRFLEFVFAEPFNCSAF